MLEIFKSFDVFFNFARFCSVGNIASRHSLTSVAPVSIGSPVMATVRQRGTTACGCRRGLAQKGPWGQTEATRRNACESTRCSHSRIGRLQPPPPPVPGLRRLPGSLPMHPLRTPLVCAGRRRRLRWRPSWPKRLSRRKSWRSWKP